MLTLEITYEGFDDEEEEITKPFYFNLNKLEASQFINGPLAKKIQKMSAEEQAGKAIDELDAVETFSELVLLAYGVRGDDDGFIKNKENREAFKSSVAFGELVANLVSDSEYATKFFVGIMPKDVRPQMQAAFAEAFAEAEVLPELSNPGHVPDEEQKVETKVMTRSEALGLAAGDLAAKIAAGWTIEG